MEDILQHAPSLLPTPFLVLFYLIIPSTCLIEQSINRTGFMQPFPAFCTLNPINFVCGFGTFAPWYILLLTGTGLILRRFLDGLCPIIHKRTGSSDLWTDLMMLVLWFCFSVWSDWIVCLHSFYCLMQGLFRPLMSCFLSHFHGIS